MPSGMRMIRSTNATSTSPVIGNRHHALGMYSRRGKRNARLDVAAFAAPPTHPRPTTVQFGKGQSVAIINLVNARLEDTNTRRIFDNAMSTEKERVEGARPTGG